MIAIGTRGLSILLILLAGVLLVGTVSCGGGGGTARITDGAGKNKKDNKSPSVAVSYRDGYTITVSGKDVSQAELSFNGGPRESYKLSKQGTCRTNTRLPLEKIKVLSKSGDYWYFDNMGNPVPKDQDRDDDDDDDRDRDRHGDDDDDDDRDDDRRGSGLLGGLLGAVGGLLGGGSGSGDCAVSMEVLRNDPFKARFRTSTSRLASVKMVLSNGNSDFEAMTGTSDYADTTIAGELSYALVSLTNGSKWFFDRNGNWLPQGYVPQIEVSVITEGGTTEASKTTSLLGAKIVAISSSDLYTQVKVALVTNSVLTYATAETNGEYNTESTENVDAVRVTLAADGSKWYFDAAGNLLPLDSKWYTDLD